jgi:hypothetical protein
LLPIGTDFAVMQTQALEAAADMAVDAAEVVRVGGSDRNPLRFVRQNIFELSRDEPNKRAKATNK